MLIKWSGIRHLVRLHDFGGLLIENCVGIGVGIIQPTYLAPMKSLITMVEYFRLASCPINHCFFTAANGPPVRITPFWTPHNQCNLNIAWVKQLLNWNIPITIYSKYHTTGEPMGFHTSLPALWTCSLGWMDWELNRISSGSPRYELNSNPTSYGCNWGGIWISSSLCHTSARTAQKYTKIKKPGKSDRRW